MNNIREKLVSTILAATIIAGITIPSTKVLAATSTEYNQAKDLVTFAKKQRNFAEYNIAYQAILKVKDEQQQNQLLSELAPLWNEVVTKDVKASLDIITIVANKLELKSYDEALSYIEKEVKNDRNSQYLKGELTSWGRAGVYTSDVTKAVDSIIRVWNEKTEQSENDAKVYISKVVKAENRTYLTAQLKEASATIINVPKAINEAKDTNSMHKALLSMNLNDYLKVPIEDRTIIADEMLKSRPKGTGYTSIQSVVVTLQKLTNEATGTYTLALQGVNDLNSKSTTEEVTNALLKVKNEEFNAMTKEAQRVIANSFKSKLVFNQAGTALKTPFITLRLVQSLMK